MEYELIRSRRRTISIQVKADGRVVVRAPYLAPGRSIEAFVEEKASWIEEHVLAAKENAKNDKPSISPEEKKQYIKKAHILIPQRVDYYAQLVGVGYNRIAIKDTRTRWGSCSGDGNLNFSYKLILMPMEILDYVVVHELCHRIYMNHSKEFWSEVERVIPDYKERRKWLKENGNTYE